MGCFRGLLRNLREKYLTRVIWYVMLNVIICNSDYCNRTLSYTIIRYLTMTFDSFVIYRYFCTLVLVQKCFVIKKIQRKMKETVTTVLYQDDGYVGVWTKTRSRPAPEAPRSGFQRFLLPDREGQCPYSALKQLQKMDLHPSASHKNMGVKSLRWGLKQR